MSYLNINLNENNNPFLDYVSSILFLHIIILLGTINIIFYFLCNYLILKYDIENKFPRFKKLINFYVNSSLILIVLEIILVLGSLLFIIYSDITIINNNINNS